MIHKPSRTFPVRLIDHVITHNMSQQTTITSTQPSELVEDEFAMGVVDEYDPFNPNDYDAIMKERNKRDDDRRDDGGRR